MIDEITKQLKPLINGKLIYVSQYGSHLYGLNTENSDLDFRGVYIPELDDIILKKDKDEINTELVLEETKFTSARKATDSYGFVHCLKESKETKEIKVDVKIFSLQKFIQLCSKADTNALDLLFSANSDIPKWYQGTTSDFSETSVTIADIYRNRDKLINTDRLESPITYAFKQATKYSIKGERRQVMLNLLKDVNTYLFLSTTPADVPLSRFMTDFIYQDGTPVINKYIDGKHVKIDVLDNKGKEEKYLYVCGVQHQFNLELKRFAQRLEEKINKEYTSQRTIDASDGNDWKALSHAIRVLLEIKELLDTGNIQFPLKDKDFLLDIKLGKVEREFIDNFFNQELSNILERVQKNELNWKYDEEFWNEFILNEVKSFN
jgi:predicted nucleotidyltransferase